MKKNLPVTDNEIPVNEELISTTDLKGAIKEYNHAFKEISGFDDDELQGVNHNVVRHPDMPPAAFQDLWDTIKQKQHWMGIVKNRCKNGDYYWVDAYVTPIFDGDAVVGYESVRVKPEPELVERAKKIYGQLNVGRKPALSGPLGRMSIKARSLLQNVTVVLLTLITFSALNRLHVSVQFAGSAAVGLGAAYVLKRWVFESLDEALREAGEEINNPLMALIYTGRNDEAGQIMLVNKLLNAKIRTMLGRLRDSAKKIDQDAQSSLESQAGITESIAAQAEQTDQVATAMTEMSATIHEVAESASQAAQKSTEADEIAQQGSGHASSAIEGLGKLDQAFARISDVVSKLEQGAGAITPIVEVINGIAEQTNLLALNAAIEAARAGEHGRGFSVVAEEVRNLASRTQQSTEEIARLIKQLDEAMAEAVGSVSDTKRVGEDSRNRVQGAIDSLTAIARKVKELSDLNTLMATAVEEQSAVSEDINKNVVHISSEADEVKRGAGQMQMNADRLAAESKGLFNMINRFRSG
ncbi:MAG: PAS domain-containing methyl-accepting chemotaxis protein [Methylophaga sp.]